MNRYKKVLIIVIIGLLILSFARVTLFIINFDNFSEYKIGELVSTFIGAIRFDLSILLTLLSPFLILLLLPIKNMIFHKMILWCIFIEYVVIVFVTAIDIGFYTVKDRHITNDLFLLSNDLDFIIKIIPSYIFPISLLVIFLILLGYFWSKFANIKLKQNIKSVPLNFLIFISIIAVTYIPIRGNLDFKPIHIIDAFDKDTTLGNLKLPGIFSIFKYGNDKTVDLSKYIFFDNATAQEIIDNFTGSNKKCNTDIVKIFSEKGVNIVFIVLEGVSAYNVGAFSKNNLGLTKNIDNLSLNSIKFNKHYSSDRQSISSLQAMMTAVPSIEFIPKIGFGLESYITGNVGKVFADNGYDTIAVQSAKRRSFYYDSILKSLGFEQYYGMEDIPILLDYKDKKGAVYGWDYDTLMFLSDKIEEVYNKNRRPFFSITFLGTTHYPLPELPSEFNIFDLKSDPDAAFKNTIAYTDWAIGEFVNSFKDKSYFENTVFIITSDHSYGNAIDIEYPDDFLIPLLIYSPKIKESIEIDFITNHLDISQTLYDIALFDNISTNNSLQSSLFCKDENSSTMLFSGDIVTMITPEGYANISFDKILDSNLKDNSTASLKTLQDYLKAYYQLVISNFIK